MLASPPQLASAVGGSAWKAPFVIRTQPMSTEHWARTALAPASPVWAEHELGGPPADVHGQVRAVYPEPSPIASSSAVAPHERGSGLLLRR